MKDAVGDGRCTIVSRRRMRRVRLLIFVMVSTIIVVLVASRSIHFLSSYWGTYSSTVYEEILIWQGGSIASGDDPALTSTHMCDYARGSWIKGDKTPLYSGHSCKQWLSPAWACRLIPDRPTFEYEDYRWQPDGCDLPEFDSNEFLWRMQNKVVAFVGDSIGMQQFQSMMCMLTHGANDIAVEDVGKVYGFEMKPGAARPEGWAKRFMHTNTTIIFSWSATLCEIVPLNKSNPDTDFSLNLDVPAIFIQKFVSTIDLLVLNTGHHWNRHKFSLNKWIPYVDGHPASSSSIESLSSARNYSLHKICAWLDQQVVQKHTQAKMYIRSLSPRHFFDGEWDSGGRCDDNPVPVEKKDITGQPVEDPAVQNAVRGTHIHVLNITYASQLRDDAHLSKYRRNVGSQDCLHWCLPGIPDLWNELLYAYVLQPDPPEISQRRLGIV